MRNILYLVTLIILTGCKINDRENTSLKGHWHCVEPCGLNKTLDIFDSITIINNQVLFGPERFEYPRVDEKNRQILPLDHFFTYSDSFTINNDTLKIYGSGKFTDSTVSYLYKYVKSNKQCELWDRYISSVVNLTLSESTPSEDYDELLYPVDLFIGTSIKPEYQRPKSSMDSIFVQADDVFIELDEVQRYCIEKESELVPNDKISLVLHADSQVNEIFIHRLIKMVPKTIAVYKAVQSEGQLRVIKLSME
jgi:hypothetical protein